MAYLVSASAQSLQAQSDGGAAAEPGTTSLHLDMEFCSLEEWLAWAAANRFVYDASFSAEVARRVLANGFEEPLTGRRVEPAGIASTSNLREGLLANGLNSRTRAVMHLLCEKLEGLHRHEVRIYGAEAVTSLALVLRGHFPRFLGSEFVSDEAARRDLYPIPFQDLTALTVPSEAFDLVTTNEVLEHVPDIDAALGELARVLKPGGWHVGTHPFLFSDARSDRRAFLVEGRVEFLKDPEYHGNPIEPGAGSLVFETPAWDILERARKAGFASAHMRLVASERYGFLTENTGVFVLCARK